MAYEGGPRGPKKTGFGGSSGGSSGPRKPYGDKPAYGSGDGAKRPYTPRAPRAEGSSTFGERKPYGDRPQRSYGDKPAYAGGGEKRPYTPRAEGSSSFGDRKPYGEKRPYTPRAEGSSSYGERKPYGDRPQRSYGDKPAYAGGGEKRPYTPRAYGDKPAYAGGGEKRPYTPRAYGDKPAYAGGGEKRPYTPRTEGSSYGPRDDSKRPYTPRAPRAPHADGGEGYTPRAPEAGNDWGDARKPRYAAKTSGRADFERTKPVEGAPTLANADGWLVGNHAVLAALNNGRRKVREVWLLADATGDLAVTLAAHPEWLITIKTREDFNREFGESVHQGIAALVGNLHQPSLPELLATKPNLLVALDQVTDPHNLGAIVRSCAAFGAKGVLVTEHRAAGVNATAAKAAAGALETVPVAEITNLAQAIKMLRENGYVCVGLAGEAEAELGAILKNIPASQNMCLVVGSEGEGLRRLTRENCDHLAKIGITSAVESLNVSVATGVALALVARR